MLESSQALFILPDCKFAADLRGYRKVSSVIMAAFSDEGEAKLAESGQSAIRPVDKSGPELQAELLHIAKELDSLRQDHAEEVASLEKKHSSSLERIRMAEVSCNSFVERTKTLVVEASLEIGKQTLTESEAVFGALADAELELHHKKKECAQLEARVADEMDRLHALRQEAENQIKDTQRIKLQVADALVRSIGITTCQNKHFP